MALPDRIHLEIVTPDRQIFSGEVESVTVPSSTRYLGILPGHAPLLAELGIGVIEFRHAGITEPVFCSWGFLEVLPDRVIILAQVAEAVSEIDENRARQAKERAEGFLHSKATTTDFIRAELALMRAVTRIDAVKRYQQQRRHAR